VWFETNEPYIPVKSIVIGLAKARPAVQGSWLAWEFQFDPFQIILVHNVVSLIDLLVGNGYDRFIPLLSDTSEGTVRSHEPKGIKAGVHLLVSSFELHEIENHGSRQVQDQESICNVQKPSWIFPLPVVGMPLNVNSILTRNPPWPARIIQAGQGWYNGQMREKSQVAAENDIDHKRRLNDSCPSHYS
jgi:hypothetical protein